MLTRFAAAALLLLASGALAQSPAAPAAPPAQAAAAAPKPKMAHVALQTSMGAILLELETERAPVTSRNFLRYVDQKRLDGVTFYRASKVAPGFGLIQGGVRNDPKKVLPAIAHEPTTVTGLSHVDGAIAMARGAPIDLASVPLRG